jgi:hypothetical protein
MITKNHIPICVALLLAAVALFSSCEDRVDVASPEGQPQLQVDAFVNNLPGPQIIRLRMTTPYLNNGPLPPALGATVKITDLIGRVFEFKDDDANGDYVWNPSPSQTIPFGIPPNVYALEINYKGEKFTSAAKMDSVPDIDSLGYELKPAETRGQDTLEAGYELTMKAKDIPGQANAYWFKAYRNGVFFNRPQDMNLAYDGAFGPGSDGVQFIPPIIFRLTPERYKAGDRVRIELHSIGIPTYTFLNLAQDQMTNTGLFARPPVNVPSNVVNQNKNSNVRAVGWFCAESIVIKEITLP